MVFRDAGVRKVEAVVDEERGLEGRFVVFAGEGELSEDMDWFGARCELFICG